MWTVSNLMSWGYSFQYPPAIVSLCFWPAGYKLEFVQPPSQVWLICLSGSQKSGKHIYRCIIKILQRIYKWRDAQGKYGRSPTPPGASTCSTTQSSPNHVLLGFYIDSITYEYSLNPWILVSNLTFCLSPLPTGLGGEAESPNILFIFFFF